MGAFDGIEQAADAFESNFVNVGDYIAEIEAVRLTRSQKDDTEYFAIDMTIEECCDAMGNANPHRPGEHVAHLIKNKMRKTFLSNVKGFIAAACGVPQSEVTAANTERAVSDEQPLAGMRIRLRARKTTTKAGHDFTRVAYRPFDDVEGTRESEAA